MPFVTPGLGFNSKLLISHETTYGTAPAAAEYAVELMSAEINPRLSVIEDPSLSGTQRSRRFIGQGGQYVEWSAKFRVGYEGILPLLRLMFPGYTGATVDTIRDHTFKEGTGATQLSWTLDFVWGNVPASTCNRLVGAYCSSFRMSGTAGTGEGAMLMLELSGVAKSATPGTTPMTGGTLQAAIGVIYHQQLRTTGNFKDGSGAAVDAIQLRSFELNVTSPFDSQRFLFGQLNAEAPVPNGFLDATFVFDEEWTLTSLMTAALANTPTALRLFFQHPTTIGTVSKRELQIDVNSPTAAEFSTAVPGFGVITQRGSFRAAYNTSDASLIVIRNRNTEVAMPF
jgi:hypothetical protein